MNAKAPIKVADEPNKTGKPRSKLDHPGKPKKEVRLKHYIFYGMGSFSNGFTAATIGFYINGYLLSVIGLDPGHITVIQIVTQIFNAISDPVVGIVSDRTETRFGRRQPYILFSAISMPLTYFLFFTSYSLKSKSANLAIYLMLFVLFYLAQTLFNVPHMALVLEMTKNEAEKNNFVMSATFFFAVGNLIGPLLLFVARDIIFDQTKRAASYSVSAAIGAVLMSAALFAVFFGLEEHREKLEVRKVVDVLKDSIHVFRYKNYTFIMLAYISTQVAVQTVQFNMEIYLLVIAKNPDKMIYIMVAAILSSLFWLLPVKYAMQKIGKRETYMASMLLFLVPFIIILAFGINGAPGLGVLLFMSVLVGLGTTAGFFLSSCMINDVIVQDYLQTGSRREGAFNSIYVFCQKVSTGCVHGLSNAILHAVGPLAKDAQNAIMPGQSEGVRKALFYTLTLMPIAVICLSFIWLYFYDLTERVVAENQAMLLAREKNI